VQELGTYLEGADRGPDGGHVRHGGVVGGGAVVGLDGGLLGGVELGLARVSRGILWMLGSEK
jgi:hypothetical protein